MRETEILVEQQPPQGVLVCDHAGFVIKIVQIDRDARYRVQQRAGAEAQKLMVAQGTCA